MSAKILIVDDEPSACLTLKNLLLPEGYTLQFAGSGSAGLDLARTWRPDVILADVMMPELDGFELCRQIRADAGLGDVPVILVTALDDPEARLRGLQAGADDFITKPIDSAELRIRLRTVTRLDRFRKLNAERLKLEEAHRELLRVHEALAASEERFRTFSERSVDGFVQADEQGAIIECNAAFTQITGLAREQALGMMIWDLQDALAVPENTSAPGGMKELLRAALHSGQAALFGRGHDVEIQTARGERRFIQQTAFPIPTPQGYRIGSVIRDVTEHRRLEAALRENEERYRIIAGAVTDYAFSTRVAENGEFAMDWVAGAFEAITGYTFDEFVARGGWRASLHPDDLAIDEHAREDLRANRGSVSEVRIFAKSGQVVHLRVYARPAWDEKANRLKAIYGAAQNITEQKRMEADLAAESARRRILFEESPDGILVIDPQTAGLLEFNTAAHTQLGYSRAEFAQLRVFDVEAQETAAATRARIADVVRNGRSDFETLQRTKQGELRHVHVTAQMVNILGQSVYYCTWRNITERRRAEAARRESDERYHLLFQTMVQGVVFQDADGRIVQANPAAERSLGLTLDQMQGRCSIDPRWRAVHEDGSDFPGETHPAMIALQTGQVVRDVVMGVFNPASDSYRWLNINAVPRFRAGAAQPYQVYTTFEDFTERKLAEEARRQSHEQLLKFAAQVPGMLYQFKQRADGSYCVPFTTDAIRDIFNCSPEDVREDFAPITQVIYPADTPGMIAVIEESARNLTPFHLECRVIQPDQSVHWVHAQSMPEKMDDGSVVWSGFSTDITERKQAEEALRESEARYRLISENAADVIWVMDPMAGKFTYVSPSVEKLRGYTPAEVMAQPVSESLTPASLKRVSEEFAARLPAFIASGSRSVAHVDAVDQPRKDGSIVHTEVTTTYASNEHGKVEIIGVSRDITERRKAEDALRASEERYRSVLENMLEGCQIISPDWRYLYVNPAVAAQGKSTREALLGHTMMEAYPGIENTELFGVLRDCMENRAPRTLRNEFVYPDGSRGLHDLSITPVPEGIFILSIDITERQRAQDKLDRTERRYRAMIEYAPDGIVLIDSDGKFKYASPSVERIFGYTQADLPACNAAGMTCPEDLPLVLAELTALIQDPARVATLQYRFQHKSGEWRWIESTFSNLLAVPNVEAIIINFRDIHARKLAEDALHRSQALLKEAQRIGCMGHMEWNGRDQMLVGSDELYDIFQLPRGSRLAQETVSRLIVPADRERIRRLDAQAVRQRGDLDYEYRIAPQDGEERWLHQIGRLTYDETGELSRMMVIVQDVTESKAAEKKLRASEEKYRGLMESLDSMIVTIDADGTIHYMNEVAARDFGDSAANLIGRNMYALFPPEIAKLELHSIRQVMHEDKASVHEAQNFVRGRLRWYRISVQPIHDEGGNATQVLINATDIDNLKTTQQELEDLNRTLEDRVRDRTAQLQAANRELESFAYSVSHDLRAPLRGIDGWSLALLEDYGDCLEPTARQYLDRVRAETQHMGNLIDALLQLSRVTRSEMQSGPVDLSAAARAVVGRLREPQPARQVEVVIQPGLKARGDNRLLDIVLTNLLGNAWKFSGANPQPRIEFGCLADGALPAREGGETLRNGRIYFVHDNGVGFDMAYAQLLFKAFQRLHRTSEFPGTGIGLATVQRIIHRHGGEVWAEAQVGQGATFYFTLGPAERV